MGSNVASAGALAVLTLIVGHSSAAAEDVLVFLHRAELGVVPCSDKGRQPHLDLALDARRGNPPAACRELREALEAGGLRSDTSWAMRVARSCDHPREMIMICALPYVEDE